MAINEECPVTIIVLQLAWSSYTINPIIHGKMKSGVCHTLVIDQNVRSSMCNRFTTSFNQYWQSNGSPLLINIIRPSVRELIAHLKYWRQRSHLTVLLDSRNT